MKKTLHYCILVAVLIIIALTACKQDQEPAPEPAPEKEYVIGDTGPAGGIIFYDKGEKTDGWRYLEAAPSDINQDSSVSFRWGVDGDLGTQTGIGTGKTNTAIVSEASMSQNPKGAALLCKEYTCGEYHDWFLPSKEELNLMYINLHKNAWGGFADKDYWSSSESSGNAPVYAYFQNFSNGYTSSNPRSYGYRVRPVRAF